MDAITYPTIKLGDQIFELKFRAGDIIRLKKNHGIEIGEMATLKGVEAFERIIILIQNGIAHQAQKTAEEVADSIDLADFAVYSEAVMQAISKVSPQALEALNRMKLQAAPATKQ